jgi:hypothetical protein
LRVNVDERVLRAGQWPRFDRYEITEGVVHPASDAHLELYDPWEEYVTTWQRRQRPPREKDDPAGPKRNNLRRLPPYHEWLLLASQLQTRDPESGMPLIGKVELTSDRRKRILAWCRHNGLLGLLHHETLEIWLPPVWELDEGNEQLGLIAVVHGWQRFGAGWAHTRRYYSSVRELNLSLRDTPVPFPRHGELRASPVTGFKRGLIRASFKSAPTPKSLGETLGPGGGLILRPLGVGGLEVAPLNRLRRYCLPYRQAGKEPSWPPPSPHDEEFWRSYGEPVSAIVSAAKYLSWIMETVATNSPKYTRPTPRQQEQLSRAQERLATYTENTWPRVVFDEEGEPQVRWTAPSLLGRFALMIMLDLVGKGTIRTCARCGTPFVSSAPQAVYCSDRCRNAVQQKVYREKHRKDG